MRRMGALLVLLAVLLAGCAPGRQVYEATFLDVFDTVTTLRGYDVSRQTFQTRAEQVHEALLEYHRLFDIYTDFPGGLKRVNDSAGIDPVAVEPEIIALLKDCRQAYDLTGGRVNAAMGSVLSLWHDAREAGLADPDHAALPDRAALEEAAKHISFDTVQLDEEAGTVYFEDPALSLDVGAVAKGYAAQLTSDTLRENGLDSFLLNAGGNVVCGGKPLDGRDFWVVGVEDLDGVSTRETLGATDLSVVTSGDYQRYYTVDGVRYHHLIDPETLYPAAHMHAVTILHPDSALGDFLSTTAFLLPYEESRALIESIPGAEAMWTLMDGTEEMTDGFRDLIELAASR